jgi:hypothetical protein
MAAMVYKLFYYPRNAGFSPHLILAELDLDYELVLVDRKSNAQKSAEYIIRLVVKYGMVYDPKTLLSSAQGKIGSAGPADWELNINPLRVRPLK